MKSGFLLEDDRRIAAKQIRDRVAQVMKSREKKVAPEVSSLKSADNLLFICVKLKALPSLSAAELLLHL